MSGYHECVNKVHYLVIKVGLTIQLFILEFSHTNTFYAKRNSDYFRTKKMVPYHVSKSARAESSTPTASAINIQV